MKKIWEFIKPSILLKVLLSIGCTLIIVYSLPKGKYFQFEFQKGKPWLNEDLLAPFDFAILKSEKDIAFEKESVLKNVKPFFRYNDSVPIIAKKKFKEIFQKFNTIEDSVLRIKALEYGIRILSERYENGIKNYRELSFKEINLVRNNTLEIVPYNDLKDIQDSKNELLNRLDSSIFKDFRNQFEKSFLESIMVNVQEDQQLTQKTIDEQLQKISQNQGFVIKNTRIISRGEIVENARYDILRSLKKEYKSKTWNVSTYNNLFIGYALVISLVFWVLLLYLYFFYKKSIFNKTRDYVFILFNILWTVLISIALVNIQPEYIYMSPICILPLILNTFYDSRIGIFIHTLTVLLLGFVAPNSFQFIFVQMIAGIFTIGTKQNLQKRSTIFISVIKMVGAYIITDICLNIIKEGLIEIKYDYLIYFSINGLLTLFTQPLTYFYEKLFRFTSSTSLLELSDTNSKLLRALSEKAVGTFQHSLQVANIASAAAHEIGANALLVRTGAMYHDIGKMENPLFFTENQLYVSNPHDQKNPLESVKIIISHVEKGIITAKKYKLPSEIINFIKTHHGTSLVSFFYKKSLTIRPHDTHEKDFRYPYSKPNSKETAILMMCDSCEAASKSMEKHSPESISKLVEHIIKSQIYDDQFSESDITFKEIEQVKEIIKIRLQSIYTIRQKYPE